MPCNSPRNLDISALRSFVTVAELGGEEKLKEEGKKQYDKIMGDASAEEISKNVEKGLDSCKDVDFSKAQIGEISGGEVDKKKTERGVQPLCGDKVAAHEDIEIMVTVGEDLYELEIEDVMVADGQWYITDDIGCKQQSK